MRKIILGIFVILSVLVGNSGASFLDNEAGMSAYTKSITSINLNFAKNAFRTIETQTSNYIIGSVPVPGLPETEDAHVYVNRDGWILAYYLRDIPVSKIVQWGNYNGGPITTTTLADVVSSVASAAGVSYPPVNYYDFKYPGANRMMMIVDWLPVAGSESYQIKIPNTFGLNENSWSVIGNNGWWGRFWAYIDDNPFPATYGRYLGIVYGYYSSLMSPDIFHNIKLVADGYGVPAGVNTVLVYRQ